MQKLNKTERFLLENKGDNYTAFRCNDHKLFIQRNDIKTGKCPHCQVQCDEYDCPPTVMRMVCLTHGNTCSQPGYPVKIGEVNHLFCCEAGFEQSLADFRESIIS